MPNRIDVVTDEPSDAGADSHAPVPTRTWLFAASLGLVVGLLWAPVIRRLVIGGPWTRVLGINDYPLHLDLSDRFSLVPYVNNSPHFLFHALTGLWSRFVSLPNAAVATLVLSIAGTFVAVVVLFSQPDRSGIRLDMRVSVVLALWYFFAEAPSLFALWWGWVPSTSPIYTLHWWGNPTWLVGLPFLVLTVPLIERVVAEPGSGRLNLREWSLLVVTVLSAVGKPALAIPLVPALPFYLVVVRRLPARIVWRVVGCCAVPAALVVAWQTWFLDTSSASEFSSGFTIEFIVDAPFGWGNVGAAFLVPLVIPVGAMLLAGRDYWRDRSIQLVLTLLAVAVPLMLLVNETGERAMHGNFAVPAQACVFLLILLSLRIGASHLLSAWSTRSRRRSQFELACAAAVAVAFSAGGLLSYLDGIGMVEVPIDWVLAISGMAP